MRFSDFVEINPKGNLPRNVIHPCVMMEDIKPGNRYVHNHRQKEFKGGTVFKSGDTLFARITPSLENGKIAQYIGDPAFGSTEFIIFRNRDGVSDSGYIFYLALTEQIRRPAEASMFGASGRQRVDVSVFSEIEIFPPNLETQMKLAAILTAYDELIENNNLRIRALERITQMIYHEWFVKFHFPGYEDVRFIESEFGNIPEGWEIKRIGEAFETVSGGTPSTKRSEYWEEGTINWFTPSDITKSGSMFIADSLKKISEAGLKKSSAKLFEPHSVMMTSRATIGFAAMNSTVACTNQGFITCVPNERVPIFQIYYWIKDNFERINQIASGATFKEISKGEFRELKFLLADKKFIERINAVINPLLNIIENYIYKNNNLKLQRDLLIPKLFSEESKLNNKIF